MQCDPWPCNLSRRELVERRRHLDECADNKLQVTTRRILPQPGLPITHTVPLPSATLGRDHIAHDALLLDEDTECIQLLHHRPLRPRRLHRRLGPPHPPSARRQQSQIHQPPSSPWPPPLLQQQARRIRHHQVFARRRPLLPLHLEHQGRLCLRHGRVAIVVLGLGQHHNQPGRHLGHHHHRPELGLPGQLRPRDAQEAAQERRRQEHRPQPRQARPQEPAPQVPDHAPLGQDRVDRGRDAAPALRRPAVGGRADAEPQRRRRAVEEARG